MDRTGSTDESGPRTSRPLAGGALKVLRALPERAPNSHVFHAQDLGAPLSNMAMAMVLRGLVGSAATVHGFR